MEVRDGTDKPLPGVEVTFSVTGGGGTLSVTSATTDVNGRAETTLTLGPNPGTNTVEVAATGIHRTQSVSAIAELPPIPQDVNKDDVVNILDLVLVASVLGDEGGDLAGDVNEDGVVNILDLVMVAGALGNAAAAPSVSLVSRPGDRSYKGGSGAVVGSSGRTRPDRCNVATRRSFLGATLRSADPERNGAIAKLSEPVQSGDVDSVWVGGGCGCHVDDL